MKDRNVSSTRIAFFLGLAAAAGCGGDGKGMDVVVHNVGDLCVYPANATNENPFIADTMPRDYVAGDVANLAVLFQLCLSGSCTADRQTTCTAMQDGNMITVDATASYRDTGGSTCTTDCALMIARCQTAPLPAGTYTFSFAHLGTALTIPSTVTAPCVGSQH